MHPPLAVTGLVKRYGAVEAVREVSFEVWKGEIFGLLGPNGAGKTSTLECAIGLRQPDAGSVRVCGFDSVAEPERVKERIGAALQFTALQDRITPREALTLFGSFYAKRADAGQLIERFSLSEKADAPFDSLSPGQRQRLALALAFVNEPEVLFLDEPTAGLDPQSRRELHQAIARMREEGRTVLLTTHYMEEAESLCDRIAIIDGGRVIATGKPETLVAQAQASPRLILRTSKPAELARVRTLPSVADARQAGEHLEITTANVAHAVIEVVRLLEAEHNDLTDLHVRKPALEDVFIELTGSRLRD